MSESKKVKFVGMDAFLRHVKEFEVSYHLLGYYFNHSKPTLKNDINEGFEFIKAIYHLSSILGIAMVNIIIHPRLFMKALRKK